MNGWLIIDKPTDWTSHDVIAKLRGILATKKIGHTGTLDPLATGVLVVGIGQATKLIQYLVGCDKKYEAQVTLGQSSDTYDRQGEVTTHPVDIIPTLDQIQAVLSQFLGNIQQTPPIYSAVKINGQPAHRLARRGQDIQLTSRPVTVYDLKIISYDYPTLKLHIHCGSGFYVRSLAHDLGQFLKTGGLLSELRRTHVGQFELKQAVILEQVTSDHLLPLETGVTLPRIEIKPNDLLKLSQGQTIPGDFSDEEIVAIFCEDRLVAIGQTNSNLLQPKKVLI